MPHSRTPILPLMFLSLVILRSYSEDIERLLNYECKLERVEGSRSVQWRSAII